MIKNDRQLRTARSKLQELRAEIAELGDDYAAVLQDFATEIEREIGEYVAVKDGYSRSFEITSLDDIANALIQARLARGLTHAQLAERVGVREQQVQRDEAGGYENASLSRLADLADALEYALNGYFRPIDEDFSPPSFSSTGTSSSMSLPTTYEAEETDSTQTATLKLELA